MGLRFLRVCLVICWVVFFITFGRCDIDRRKVLGVRLKVVRIGFCDFGLRVCFLKF